MTRKHSSLPRDDEPSISLSALKRVSDRLHRRFEEENVLPLPTVQYVLSETGPALARIEPRELRAALEVLADNPAPAKDLPHGPWEPRPAVYVVPSFTKTNSKANAAIAAATKEEQLRAFREARPGNRALQLAIEIAKSLPNHRFLACSPRYQLSESLVLGYSFFSSEPVGSVACGTARQTRAFTALAMFGGAHR